MVVTTGDGVVYEADPWHADILLVPRQVGKLEGNGPIDSRALFSDMNQATSFTLVSICMRPFSASLASILLYLLNRDWFLKA